MAKITLLSAEGNIQLGQLGAPGVPQSQEIERSGSRVLAGTQEALGQTAEQLSNLLSESRRVDELNTNKLKAEKAADDVESRYREDPDIQSIVPRFDKDLERIQTATLKNFSHPQAREQFEAWFGAYAQTRHQAVFHHVVRREQEQQTKNLVDGLLTTLNLIGKAVDPDQIEILRQQGLKSIEDRFSVGGIPAEKAGELKGWMTKKVGILKARQDILQDPNGALLRLKGGPWEELYPGLTEEDRIGLIYQAQGQVNDLESQVKQEKVLLRKETEVRMKDNLASILETGKEVPIDNDAVEALFDRVTASQYAEDVRHHHMAYRSGVKLRTASPEERKAVLDSIKPDPGAPGFAGRMRIYELVAGKAGQIEDAVTRDPAGYALASGAKTVDQAIALQEHMGVSVPKVLSKAHKETIKAKFEAATPEKKIEIIQKIGEQRGPYFNQVLQELNLGYNYTYAAYLPTRQGKRVMQVLEMKDSEFGMDQKLKAEIGQAADAGFYSGDRAGNVLTQVARLTGNVKFSEMAQQLGQITRRMAWHMGSANQALKYLWEDDYNYIIDKGLAFVYFPKAYDTSEMEERLKEARKVAVMFLSAEQKKTGIEKFFVDEYTTDVRVRGTWISSPEADNSFTLIDSVTGKAVARKDGRPIKMHYSGYITR